MMEQDFQSDKDLKDRIDVDKAFKRSESDRKDALNRLETKKRMLEEETMKDTQRAVLEELVPEIVDAVKDNNEELFQKMKSEVEDVRSSFTGKLKRRDERINEIDDRVAAVKTETEQSIEDMKERVSSVDELEDEIGSMKSERKRELDDIHDRISSVQKKLDKNNEKIKDKVSDKVEDTTEDIRTKVEQNASKIETLDGSSNSLEDIEDRLDEIEKKFDRKTGELEQVEERLEDEELVSADTDVVKLQEKVREHQKQVERLEDKIDELSEIEVDQKLKNEIVREINGEKVSKSSTTTSRKKEDVRTPGDVNETSDGEKVKVKGRLQFKKKAGGRRFYKISGEEGSLVVAAEKKIPEGPRTLEGKVKNVKGNICLVVD